MIKDDQAQPLTGALIYLEYPWSEIAQSVVSDEAGKFEISNVEYGGYKIRISFLGFKDIGRELNIDQPIIDLGQITLVDKTMELSEVEVREQLPIATQNGDTTSFNANAFKTLPDASAEDLIRKMPGVVIQDGKVQAQGEDVKQVLVDGLPFFGNDPNAALKNLPAEVVQKIEVFDQQSEQARFSGFDDGNTTKTINIVTKPNMRNGQFGKIYAGGGGNPNAEDEWQSRYEIGGNASLFNGKQRISLIGQSNNVNQQNFSTEDLLGVTGSSGRRRGGRRGGSSENFLVPGSDGIATTQALGINYSDQWGEKLKISGSYFFNNNDLVSGSNIHQEYIADELAGRDYFEDNESKYANLNHRLNLRIEAELDSFTSLIFRPRISWQGNEGSEAAESSTRLFGEKISQTNNQIYSDLSANNWNGDLLLRRRFKKRGRTISLNIGSAYNNSAGEEENNSALMNFGFIPDESISNRNYIDNIGNEYSANLNYTEPLGKSLSLMFSYGPEFGIDKVDELTFNINELGEDGDQEIDLSNQLENRFFNQSIGAGIRYRKGRDFFMMARLRTQFNQQELTQQLPGSLTLKRNFVFLTPFAVARWNKSRQETYRLFYRGNVSAPEMNQLVEAVDLSNPLQLTIGNAQLKPSQNHRIFGRWQKTNTEKATLLYINLGATFSPDAIVNAVYYRPTDDAFFEDISWKPGTRLTRPVNLNNSWSTFSFITYGLPIKKIKCNLNFNVNFSLTNTPGLVDDIRNDALISKTTFGLTFSSNFSEKLDFNIGTNTSWQQVDHSVSTDLNARYLDHRTFAKLDWILPADFVIRSNISHRHYEGFNPAFQQDYLLLTLGLGKKVFKDKRGEILVSVFDLLEQNNIINRNITPVYIEDITSLVLQRYFMLSFTYNFRNFSLKGSPVGIEEEKPPWDRRRN